MPPTPEISVVVSSHDRPLRLRWLLNALEEQTLAPERWEVVVVHDSGKETEELLDTHPLAQTGLLRQISIPPGKPPGPGRKRNLGWREAKAPLIAFTDDDCRPPKEWLENALNAAQRNPGAIVQGAVGLDPEEERIAHHATWVKTISIVPPRPWGQCCNIVYPRPVLEEVGGFDPEHFPRSMAEDTDLAVRARATGAPYIGAPEVITFHAVTEASLRDMMREAWRWRDLPMLVRRHPVLREHFTLWGFYKRSHVWVGPAIAGWVLMKRSRLFALLAVPYVVHVTPKHHGQMPRGRIRALSELPGRMILDVTEVLSLAWGSIKHRTFFL